MKWEWLTEFDTPDYSQCFPVLNNKLHAALDMPFEAPPKDNRYIKYNERIQLFYNTFLNHQKFWEVIPIHQDGFLPVNQFQIDYVSEESNLLQYRDGTGIVPKYDFKKLKPV